MVVVSRLGLTSTIPFPLFTSIVQSATRERRAAASIWLSQRINRSEAVMIIIDNVCAASTSIERTWEAFRQIVEPSPAGRRGKRLWPIFLTLDGSRADEVSVFSDSRNNVASLFSRSLLSFSPSFLSYFRARFWSPLILTFYLTTPSGTNFLMRRTI